MTYFNKLLISNVILSLFLLAGCSSDSSTSNSSNYALGTVSKLGSVYVNGERYDTSSASITVDGVNATDSEVLNRPVVVSSSSTNVATSVKAETAVKGTVDSVNSATSSWVIMGQTVRLDDGGTLSGTPIAGDLVEVSGLVKPGGIIVATIVEEKNALTEYKIKGYISSVNTSNSTFVIGGKTINYASANISDLGGNPAVDMLVEVKADADASPLIATVVETDDIGVNDATHVEVEGYILDITGSNPNFTFTVSGVAVSTNSNTTFETGNSSYLANNVKVEVEGSLSGGTLTASKVSLRDSVRVEGDITGLSGNNFNITNMTGITFTVDANTEYNSSNDQLSDFANGTHVRLRGVPTGATSVLITRLDERSADTAFYLRGPAETDNDTDSITVLGEVINISTGFTYEDMDGGAIADDATFLSQVSVGTPVKISGDSGTYDTIELED